MDKVTNVNDLAVNSNGAVRHIAIDTNVLLWMFYGNVSYVGNARTQQKDYQKVLKTFLSNKNVFKLHTTGINVNEALHVIEKTECEIYNQSIVNGFELTVKDFRNIPQNKINLQKTFKLFWQQIVRLIKIENVSLTKDMVRDYIIQYDRQNYDSLDFALVRWCQENSINVIMTDDIDFVGNDIGIEILTANPKALQEYRKSV
ncbi:MAG: PIN domain-containing protein [Phascolarctobacterium sp.]|nr:PIN domain-containing protein [Phascolarctobacterium sp.]